MTSGAGKANGALSGQLAELRRLQAERDAVRAKLAKSSGGKKDGGGDGGGGGGAGGGKKLLDIGKILQQFKEGVDKVVSKYMDQAAGPSKDQGKCEAVALGVVLCRVHCSHVATIVPIVRIVPTVSTVSPVSTAPTAPTAPRLPRLPRLPRPRQLPLLPPLPQDGA